MLDRGVTLPGLAVTYITRWARENQADTGEQRSFAGLGIRRVSRCVQDYAPEDVLRGYAQLLGHEDDLWAS